MDLQPNTNSDKTVTPPSMLRAALTLARRGLAVFPCQPQDKIPATKHGLLDATTDLTTVKAWWRQCPDFNIGVACGPISDIMVIDVDGIDAEGELARLEALHTALPRSVEAITARGRHIYLRYPDREVRNSASKIADKIDVRGAGGYVVCPPSRHPSGVRYTWSVDSAGVFAAAPDWILSIIAEPAEGKGSDAAKAALRELIGTGVTEGARNTTIARLCGHLLRHYVDPLIALQLVIAYNDTRCHPPLSHEEIFKTLNSIAAREMTRRARQ